MTAYMFHHLLWQFMLWEANVRHVTGWSNIASNFYKDKLGNKMLQTCYNLPPDRHCLYQPERSYLIGVYLYVECSSLLKKIKILYFLQSKQRPITVVTLHLKAYVMVLYTQRRKHLTCGENFLKLCTFIENYARNKKTKNKKRKNGGNHASFWARHRGIRFKKSRTFGEKTSFSARRFILIRPMIKRFSVFFSDCMFSVVFRPIGKPWVEL